MSEKVTISGVELTLSEPADVDMIDYVGKTPLPLLKLKVKNVIKSKL